MNNKQKIKKVKVSKLYKIAEELRKSITDENEIEQIDRTQEFAEELEDMIINGELIIANINAKVRLGKSTLAASIALYIFNLLKKHGHIPKNKKFGMKNICRDQHEYSKEMRDPNLSFDVKVVDEDNDLEDTGENSTVEQALRKVISKVQAVRYVHTVWCSPKDRANENADIMLSVIGRDKNSRITHAKLYYRYFEGGQEYEQLLGYIRWPVGPVCNTWEDHSKHLFFKNNKTQQEKEKLNWYTKNDWFTEYNIKKSEKIDLMTKEGVFNTRKLEYAKIMIKVIEKLKKLASLPKTVMNANIIRNYVKIECKNEKVPLSIVGEELATREVQGVIDLYKAQHGLIKEIEKAKKEKRQALEDGHTTIATTKTVEITNLASMIQEVTDAIEIQMDEYKRLTIIEENYRK